MKISDAAHILGLTGEITAEIVKKVYRAAAQKYHPDRNPAGLLITTLIEPFGFRVNQATSFSS